MDAEMPTAPTPAIRSAVTVPRPKTTPVTAPRTTIATAAPRAVSTALQNDTRSTAPEPPQLECPLCRRRHRLPRCGIFKGMTPQQRQQVAQAHGHCLNCLAPTHRTQKCTTGYQCQICMRHHHTLLHRTAVPDAGRRDVPRSRNAIQRLPRSQPRRPAYHTEDSRSWRRRTPTPNRRRQPGHNRAARQASATW
uniref:Uncharacterized protein n=1 Tax=Bactrocera latifrons TaxID=174628 RepID=A0A0K8VZ62_BACLA